MRLLRIVFFLICLPISSLVFLLPSYSADDGFLPIAQKIEPSVVVILTYDAEGKSLSQGSGFFAGDKGYVITSLSNIQGASKVEIRTAEDQKYQAKGIIGENKGFDLVILSADIPQDAAHPLILTDSVPEIGDKILVVDCSFRSDSALLNGTISSLNEGPGFINIMQTNVSISRTQSGSPAANTKGEIIGMATFGLSEEEDSSFVIPSKVIMALKPGKLTPFDKWAGGNSDESVLAANRFYAIGLRLMWTKEYEKALSNFEKCVDKNPSSDGYLQIGRCNAGLEHFEKSLEANKQAINLDPNSYKAYNNLGVDYAALGKNEEAIEAYKQALRISPDSPEAYSNLGTIYVRQKKHKEVLEIYNELVRLEPEDYYAHYCLGWAYAKLGNEEKAVEEFKKSLSLNPDDAKVRTNLGVSYGNLGKYDEAIKELKEAVRLKPDDALAHCNLGWVYGDVEKYKEAIRAYKEAIRLKPDYADAYFGLGWIYGDLGLDEESIKAYKKAIHSDPNHADAYNNLGTVYERLEKYKEAINSYKEAVRINPDYADAHYNIGVVYGKLDKYKESIEAYKEAIRIDPKYIDAHYNLGYSYFKIGDSDAALKEIKLLEDLDKDLAAKLSDLIKKEAN